MAEQNVKLAYEQELKLDDMVFQHPIARATAYLCK